MQLSLLVSTLIAQNRPSSKIVVLGLRPVETLRSTTQNPPTFFTGQSEFGIVAPGKIADLVLLDANPLADIRNTRRIEAVVMGGEVFERPDLDSMLAGVASAVARGTGCAAEKQEPHSQPR